MMSRLRRRLPMPLRLLLLAVMLLGTAGGALAAALGDLHALSHAETATQPHPLSHASIDAAADDDGTRLLHALVHCGHCHGHGGVLPLVASAWTLPDAPAHIVPTGMTAQLLAQPPESLLRPPIAV